MSSPRRERTRFMKRHVSRHAVTIDTSKAKSNADVVRLCVKELGLVEFPFGRKELGCDIYWNEFRYNDNHAPIGGRVNKFPGMEEVCSKMTLSRCLDIMRDLYPEDYDFYPRTWYLPAQYEDFCKEAEVKNAKKRKFKQTYIVKPYGGSSGEGIFLLKEPKDYISCYPSKRGTCHVAQEYVSNVYLIDDFKFDFRIYVVLKSLEPLEFHICKEGLARFSTVPYKRPTKKNIHESFMHLTNYSLNKRSKDFCHSEEEDEGSKRTLSSVMRRIDMDGQDSREVWENIELVVCKTIMAIVPEVKVAVHKTITPGKTGPSFFQILGFDILLTDDLKPILLEVNSSPSLFMDSEEEVSPGVTKYVRSPKDEEVKFPLVRDTILLVLSPNKRKHCEKRRRKRLMHLKKLMSCNESVLSRTSSDVTTCVQMYEDGGEENVEDEDEDEEVNQQMSELHVHMDLDCATNEMEEEKFETVPPDSDHKLQIQEEDLHNPDGDHEEAHLEESCLKQLYPDPYQEECDQFHILGRVAKLYMNSLGVRKSAGMSSSSFRTFIRKCEFGKKGLTSASVDIMYLDLQRRWDNMNPDLSGLTLSFQAFLDACFEISKVCFPAATKLEMLDNFVGHCESHLCLRENED